MATIREDYVSFEIAKLLKEKGFDIPCNCYGSYNGVNLTYRLCITDKYTNWNKHTDKFIISCPTLQMVMRWLREVHNIYYEIQLLLGVKAERYGDLQLGVYQLSSSGAYIWKEWIYADTYVELYKNYIKYCLKNLIKN